MDGFLVVNKPSGITSFAVVARVRRLSGEKRVGHTGTLDPLAGGVLPLCLGKATRVVDYMTTGTKLYRAEMRLGLATDSGDIEGEPVSRGDWTDIGREAIEAALSGFRGVIAQTPPMFSARKHHGQRLYTLARAGITVERTPAEVTISRLELISFDSPTLTLEVGCSRGTYIRSLATDLGQHLGCGACLSGLTRLRDGVFEINDALSLEEVEDLAGSGRLAHVLKPIDCGLGEYPAVTIPEEMVSKVRGGQLISLEVTSQPGLCRAYTEDGRLLAMLRFEAESGQWHPEKVFIRDA